GFDHGSTRSYKRIENNPPWRTCCEDRARTQRGRVHRRVAVRAPLVLGSDTPNVPGLRPFGVIGENVESLFLEVFCASGYCQRVGMRCALVPANDHTEIVQLPTCHTIKGPP